MMIFQKERSKKLLNNANSKYKLADTRIEFFEKHSFSYIYQFLYRSKNSMSILQKINGIKFKILNPL